MPASSRTRSPAPRSCGGIFDVDGKKLRLETVSRQLEDPAVWNDNKRALELGKEKKQLEGIVTTLSSTVSGLSDASELFKLAQEENDEATLGAVQKDAVALERAVPGLEFKRMFNDPLDPNNCFLDIQAGSGGTEAQDWGQMLLRMYTRYCERKGFTVELLEESPGEGAGIKSASLKVSGDYAYGHLRTETGVHRLVRKSPFDANFSSGQPTSFTIGTGAVIKGWDQALVGKAVGSRVLLSIPPDLGYGEEGNKDAGITGTDTLYFVIDILAAG